MQERDIWFVLNTLDDHCDCLGLYTSHMIQHFFFPLASDISNLRSFEDIVHFLKDHLPSDVIPYKNYSHEEMYTTIVSMFINTLLLDLQLLYTLRNHPADSTEINKHIDRAVKNTCFAKLYNKYKGYAPVQVIYTL